MSSLVAGPQVLASWGSQQMQPTTWQLPFPKPAREHGRQGLQSQCLSRVFTQIASSWLCVVDWVQVTVLS